MKKEYILIILRRQYKELKRFLTSRDLFLFLFFLGLSFALWALQALRKEYEAVVPMSVEYVNVPADFASSENLQSQIKVTVRGKGTSLFGSYVKNQKLVIDMERFKGKSYLLTRSIESDVQKRLSSNSNVDVVRISPDTLHVKLEKLVKKSLPVRLDYDFEYQKGYRLSGDVKVVPEQVDVYALQSVLDSMEFVMTNPVILKNVKDTVRRSVDLALLDNVSFVTPSVEYIVMTEKYTEKVVEVPVTAVNLPSGLVLRTFPSSVNITFNVGEKFYSKATADKFEAYIDYKELKKDKSEKAKIFLKCSMKEATDMRSDLSEVDFLLENK